MTSTTELATMIRTDLDAHADDTCASTTFKLTRDLMLNCSHELTASLTTNNSDYYFSDSSYDEINNPANIISDCAALIDTFYDADTFTDDMINQLIINIDYATAYELDSFADLDAIRTYLLDI